MTEPASSIAGDIAPGRQALGAFPFHTGPVGVRERQGWLDVAFFVAKEVKPKLPTEGLLDGAKVWITAVTTRPLDPTFKRGMQAITATVVAMEEAGR